jgi:hypothetical protein
MSTASGAFSRLLSLRSSYQQFIYGLTPFAAILFFKFLLQQIKNNQLVIDNSIDIIKIARKRYEKRQILPRVADSTNNAEFILKVDQGKHFKHQVAGHTTHVMLKHKDMILKPLIKLDLFLRELKFYESMASNEPHSAHFPYQFIPRYHGVIMGENTCGKRTPYLALEDVSKTFRHPCMMDLKMGRETFEPTAPLEKKIQEKVKYKYQAQVGFRICGFKVYDALAQSYHRVDKKFGRSLTPDLVEHGLAAFFHNGLGHFRLDVLGALVQKLELLLQWLLKQNKWHFYCSSLLITYDAEVLARERLKSEQLPHRHILLCCMDAREHNQAKGGGAEGEEGVVAGDTGFNARLLPPPACSTRLHTAVDVRMIDHAHTLESTGSNDDSYIYSIRNLIVHLELILLHAREGEGGYCEPSALIADALSR